MFAKRYRPRLTYIERHICKECKRKDNCVEKPSPYDNINLLVWCEGYNGKPLESQPFVI